MKIFLIYELNGLIGPRLEDLLKRNNKVYQLINYMNIEKLNLNKLEKKKKLINLFNSLLIDNLIYIQDFLNPKSDIVLLKEISSLLGINLINIKLDYYATIINQKFFFINTIKNHIKEKNSENFNNISVEMLMVDCSRSNDLESLFIKSNLNKTNFKKKNVNISLIDDLSQLILNLNNKKNIISKEVYELKKINKTIKSFFNKQDFIENLNLISTLNVNYIKIETFLRQSLCCLNPIYIKSHLSMWNNKNIGMTRFQMGLSLSHQIPNSIKKKLDMIVPVPETGKIYAQGVSKGLNIPYVEALSAKNSLGRSFQIQDHFKRAKIIRKKLILNNELVKGKSIGLVDEAIFTGSTIKLVVDLLKLANTKSIYLLIPTSKNYSQCEFNFQPKRNVLLEYIRLNRLNDYFDVNDIVFKKFNSMKEDLGVKNIHCFRCFLPKIMNNN